MPRYNPKKKAAKAANNKSKNSNQNERRKEKRQSTGLTTSFRKGTTGGVDFVKTKRKVGKKIKKSASGAATEAKVTSKKVNVLEQSVATNLSNDGVLRTHRGVAMQELVNRTTHHGGKTRKEALDGMLELLSSIDRKRYRAERTVVTWMRTRCAKRCARDLWIQTRT